MSTLAPARHQDRQHLAVHRRAARRRRRQASPSIVGARSRSATLVWRPLPQTRRSPRRVRNDRRVEPPATPSTRPCDLRRRMRSCAVDRASPSATSGSVELRARRKLKPSAASQGERRRVRPRRPDRCALRARAAPAAASAAAARSSRCGSAPISSARCASMKPVSKLPARKSGALQSARQKRRHWLRGPTTTVSSQRRRRAASSACVAGRAVRDHLGDHRIVEGRDLVALPRRRYRRARPRPAGNSKRHELAGRRQEAALRDPRHRAAPRWHGRRCASSSCVERQRLAGGDAELPLDQIEPGDRLGHRMLDLQPRVHLHEPEAVGAQALARRRR